MALNVALIITGIAIGLLVIYAADIAIGYTTDSGDGFIPFDDRTRGMGLGLPALVLPIVGYLITRKEPSKPLGFMIFISGILIIIGGIVVIVTSNPEEMEESGRNIFSATIPLVIPGLIQIGLGILKIKKS